MYFIIPQSFIFVNILSIFYLDAILVNIVGSVISELFHEDENIIVLRKTGCVNKLLVVIFIIENSGSFGPRTG